MSPAMSTIEADDDVWPLRTNSGSDRNPSLVCSNVSFRYDKSKSILSDVSFVIGQGEIFGLLGPNGAGKSTLMKLLLGLNKPSQGSISWFGEPLSKKTKHIIGYVPQDLALIYDLSAIDNVRFFGRLYGLRGSVLADRVKFVLSFVGLWDERKNSPSKFSGGMKRRLNIACGLVHDPAVIIMDEPTVGVDPQSRNNILESIESLRESGKTVIYISHYMEEVERLCTRVGVMDAGKFLADGTKAELLAEYSPEAIVTLEISAGMEVPINALTDFTVLSRSGQSISLSVPDGHLDALTRVSDELGGLIKSFKYIPPNLEQVFFRLTSKTLRD